MKAFQNARWARLLMVYKGNWHTKTGWLGFELGEGMKGLVQEFAHMGKTLRSHASRGRGHRKISQVS